MLISRFQDVYDLFFAEIGQDSVKFLASAVALELIDSDHLRELQWLAVLDVPEEADDGRDGQPKFAGDRGIGAAVPKAVDQSKDGSLRHALILWQKRVRLSKVFPAGAGIPALAQNKDNRLFKGRELLDALQTVIMDFICPHPASRAHALFSRLLDKDFKNFFRFADLFNRNLLQSEQLFCIIRIEHI